MLDSKLDELNSALDYLEQKNDNIHERLKELLQSNKDIRQELRQENTEPTADKWFQKVLICYEYKLVRS